MGLKLAPIASRDVLIGVVLLAGGYVAYTAARAFADKASAAIDSVSDLVNGGAVRVAANAVDSRAVDQDPNSLSLGGVQQAVSNAVQRGQDAGATNFVSAYFKGLFL